MTFHGDVYNDSLGTVYVQPDGDAPPVETLFIVDAGRFGITLVDKSGTSVSPKSQRLGYHGPSGVQKYSIVCEDGTDPALLRSAGYNRVITRG